MAALGRVVATLPASPPPTHTEPQSLNHGKLQRPTLCDRKYTTERCIPGFGQLREVCRVLPAQVLQRHARWARHTQPHNHRAWVKQGGRERGTSSVYQHDTAVLVSQKSRCWHDRMRSVLRASTTTRTQPAAVRTRLALTWPRTMPTVTGGYPRVSKNVAPTSSWDTTPQCAMRTYLGRCHNRAHHTEHGTGVGVSGHRGL